MPEIGRMMIIDDHYFNYFYSSPYAFVLNNPIIFSDPTGMDTTKAIIQPGSRIVPPPSTAPPSGVYPAPWTTIFTIPTPLSVASIFSLIFMMGGDSERFDYVRYLELQDKEDTGTLKEDERQQLESMRKKAANPFKNKTDAQLIKDKKSHEELIEDHTFKIKFETFYPESYFGNKLEGLSPEERQRAIDGRINTLKRQRNKQMRNLIQIKETIESRKK